jgi:hypothetical protein
MKVVARGLRELPEVVWHRAGTETEPKHDVEEIHSIASGRIRRGNRPSPSE